MAGRLTWPVTSILAAIRTFTTAASEQNANSKRAGYYDRRAMLQVEIILSARVIYYLGGAVVSLSAISTFKPPSPDRIKNGENIFVSQGPPHPPPPVFYFGCLGRAGAPTQVCHCEGAIPQLDGAARRSAGARAGACWSGLDRAEPRVRERSQGRAITETIEKARPSVYPSIRPSVRRAHRKHSSWDSDVICQNYHA